MAVKSKRRLIREISFVLASVLVAVGSVLWARDAERQTREALLQAETEVLLRLSEEVRTLSESESPIAEGRVEALSRCRAAMALSELLTGEAVYVQAVAGVNAFLRVYERVLADATLLYDDTLFRETAGEMAALLESVSLALLSAEDGDAPVLSLYTEALLSLCRDFPPERFRVTGRFSQVREGVGERDVHYQYENEPIVPAWEAEGILRELIGAPAARLTLQKENETSDGREDTYLFTCSDGYAEISRAGGHLLRYAIAPHADNRVSVADRLAARLPDEDLQKAATRFAEKAVSGTDHSGRYALSHSTEGHGIRSFFFCGQRDEPLFTVSVRCSDGSVLAFEGEGLYLAEP